MIEPIGTIETAVKYIVRVCHMACMTIVCHKTITDFYLGELTLDHEYFYMIAGIMAIVSGISAFI